MQKGGIMNITLFREKRLKAGIGTWSELAEKMGMKNAGLSMRLRGQRQFRLDEILTVADILHLTKKDIINIFFEKYSA